MSSPVKSPAKRVNGVLPKPTADIEVGVAAHLPFATPYKDAWEVLRDDAVTVKQLTAMRNSDGQARALYRLITLPIRAALKTATFVPEEYVDGGEEEAAFIEQMLTMPASAGGMSVPFNRVIAQMLLALFDGFSAFELVYWSPSDGPLKGKWTLKKVAHRPSETLTFLLDDRSEYAGLRQRTMYQGRTIDVFIPPEHSIYYAANEEERPFYGHSYFHEAFYHWDKKYKLYAICHIAAQRAAVGTRVGKLPANPSKEDRDKFVAALAKLGIAQSMTMPNDYDVDSLKESVGFDFLAYINHHNSQMSKSILAGFFDKEQGGGDAGKLVDFGTQSDSLFLTMLQTIMGEIEDVINQKIIPRFIDWNFNSKKYPKFQFGSLSEEQKAVFMDLFKTLAVGGQSITIRPEFLHEMEKQAAEELGLELDWETIEQRMEEEEALAAEQEAMMFEQQMAGPQVGGAPGAGGGTPGADKTGPAQVDPTLVPQGFTLSAEVDPEDLALTELAAELLEEASETIELVRGRAATGVKYVQTAAGAKIYGVPIGSPITRDMQAKKAGAEGVKGKEYGGRKGAKNQTSGTKQGGGPGAKSNQGGVVTEGNSGLPEPKRTYTNPKQPGARLIDFGDGTVAIIDPAGRISPRQKFDVGAFVKYGWTVEPEGESKAEDNDKPRSGQKRALRRAAKNTSKAADKE